MQKIFFFTVKKYIKLIKFYITNVDIDVVNENELN